MYTLRSRTTNPLWGVKGFVMRFFFVIDDFFWSIEGVFGNHDWPWSPTTISIQYLTKSLVNSVNEVFSLIFSCNYRNLNTLFPILIYWDNVINIWCYSTFLDLHIWNSTLKIIWEPYDLHYSILQLRVLL